MRQWPTEEAQVSAQPFAREFPRRSSCWTKQQITFNPHEASSPAIISGFIDRSAAALKAQNLFLVPFPTPASPPHLDAEGLARLPLPTGIEGGEGYDRSGMQGGETAGWGPEWRAMRRMVGWVDVFRPLQGTSQPWPPLRTSEGGADR